MAIVDARDVGRGATHASAGVLAPYIEAHEGGTLLDLTVRSLELYDAWIDGIRAESGIDVEYRRSGSLEVALDARTASRLLQMPARFAAREKLLWLDAAQARRTEPALSDSALGALAVPAHGYVAATVLTEALARAAIARGASVHNDLSRQPRSIAGVISSRSAPWMAAPGGQSEWWWPAGSWTGQLEGLGSAAHDVRPVRGQLLRVIWRSTPLRQVIWGPDCYLVPWADGTVLIGATVEDVGFDERNTVAGVRTLLVAAQNLLPGMEDATFLEARVGLRPATSDGLPIIGQSDSTDRVVYATGHYRNGILLAPLTAKLIADLVIDNRRDPVPRRSPLEEEFRGCSPSPTSAICHGRCSVYEVLQVDGGLARMASKVTLES